MTKFIDDDLRRQQHRRARLPKYKTALLNLLRRSGAVSATVEYDGEGDSGQIESVIVHNAGGERLSDAPLSQRALKTFAQLPLFDETLFGALEAFAWEMLSLHHQGFQDNDGAFGTITLDVKSRTAVIDHNARFSDSVNSKTEV